MNQLKKNKINILVVDDHPLVRDAIANHLQKQSDLNIIAEAADGEEAVRIALKLIPDVIIMDIGISKLNGVEATRQIKVKHPDMIVLVLSVYEDIDHITKALDAGASGYLTKGIFGEEISNAVRAVVSGESVLPRKLLPLLLKRSVRNISKYSSEHENSILTERELEILKLAAMGLSNQDIAQELNLSLRTIKGYFAEIFSKFNVTSRTAAVILALKSDLFSLDDIS